MEIGRKKILFFGRLAQPLPSDESDDSDFELPGSEQDGTWVKRRKIRKERSSDASYTGKMRKAKRKGEDTKIENEEENTISHGILGGQMECMWSENIPVELLLRIFHLSVESIGSVPFLCRMSRVCRRWKEVASEPLLWRKVDLSSLSCLRSANDCTVERLAPTRLTTVKVLNLHGWKKLTDKGLKAITGHCTQLQSIVLSECSNVSSKGIASFADSCFQLCMIDAAMTKIDVPSLHHLTNKLGNQLREISLMNCSRLYGALLLSCIQHCPNLTALDLSGTNLRKLNVEKLQAGCPKLRDLYLANLLLHSTPISCDKETGGFPQLETLSLACGSLGGLAFTDQVLFRILKTSTNLRSLDVRGLHRISAGGLERLPVASLRRLFFSDSQAEFDAVAVVVKKWHHSLEVLDISSNRGVCDEAMELLYNFQMPQLRVLDLGSTAVTSKGVRKVLDGCPNLKDLNLTSCRGVPRGIKQRHEGARFDFLICRLQDDQQQRKA